MKRKYIRIIAIPPGEAPEEVREAWIGVRIPLPLLHKRPKQWRAAGVLSGPRTLLARLSALFSNRLERKEGYAVSVVEAVAALEAVKPEAAMWWRKNAAHLVKPGKAFLFPSSVCVEERDIHAS